MRHHHGFLYRIIDDIAAERDRARDLAAALEQIVANVEAECQKRDDLDYPQSIAAGFVSIVAIRRALDGDL